MYVAYREMSYYLSNQIPFNGNSVTAVNVLGEYKVFSYNTLIFSVIGNAIYFNNNYFSPTTSKLQNMLIRAYGLNKGICKRG